MFHLFAPIQLLWNRISFSRLTLFYFLFSFSHFIIQLSFQIKAFTINDEAARFLTRIVTEAQTTNHSLPVLNGSTLRMCSWVPSNLDVDNPSCPIVWDGYKPALNNTRGNSMNGTKGISTAIPVVATLSVSLSSSVSPQPAATINDNFDNALNNVLEEAGVIAHNDLHARNIQILPDLTPGQISITLKGIKGNDSVILENSCLWSLNWPVSVLSNTKREDLVFVAFQFWVFGMSIVALLNESIAHIMASLLMHIMATAWAAFQITRTADFHSDFNRVITNGACQGVSLLPDYWHARSEAEIPSLALNVIALFVSCILTYKLIKLFRWQTFKRFGASPIINRIYKLVFTLLITIQLSLFFMMVTVSLWIDKLMNSIIGDLAEFQILYKVSSFITLALLIPWLMTGWFAVHRELRVPMLIFLILSMLYLAGWGVMFASTTFRWTFITWTFFSLMATTSVVLTLLSTILGVVCRLNFGKGLARYLNPHQGLDGGAHYYSDGYADTEKVAFPPYGQPIPTYAGDIKPTYSQPRGVIASTEHWVTFPEAVLQRNVTNVQVYRNNSCGSLDSSHSGRFSDTSLSRNGSQTSYTSQTRRWVIE